MQSQLWKWFFEYFPYWRSSEERALVGLASFGLYSGGSSHLTYIFSQFGVVHLLVLSGSQIGHLKRVVNAFFLLLPVELGLKFFRFRQFLFYAFALQFLILCGFQAPLVRATLAVWVGDFAYRLGAGWQLLLVCLLHIILFPSHLMGLSFYLSWISFLLLIYFEKKKWSVFVSLFCLSCCCQIAVQIIRGGTDLTWGYLCFVGLCNLVFVFIFERVFFPLIAVFVILVILSLWSELIGWSEFGLVLSKLWRLTYMPEITKELASAINLLSELIQLIIS